MKLVEGREEGRDRKRHGMEGRHLHNTTQGHAIILEALRIYFLPRYDAKSSVFSFVFEKGNNYTRDYTKADEKWPACMFG